MRATICAIGWIFAACASLPGQSPTLVPVTVVYQFDHLHSSIAFQEMQRELAWAMKPLGYAPEWRDVKDGAEKDSFENLVMVGFNGRCSMEAPDLPGQTDGALARTHVSQGTVLPFSEVECDSIRASLHSAGRALAHKSDADFGRAMARVLAHELFHVLKRTRAHASDGIQKKSFSRSDLVAERLQFR